VLQKLETKLLILLILPTLVILPISGQQNDTSSEVLFESKSTSIVLRDKSLTIEPYVSGLSWPTTMAFVGDDILVLEKNLGNVRLVRDGKLQPDPVLTLQVSSTIEEGLLGILAKNNDIYLHFTTRDSENKVSNWFYKYRWDGNRLVEPLLLKVIHGGDGMHNSGVMIALPSGDVYAVIGDLDNRKGILQNYQTEEPDDTSVIFPLESDDPYYAIGIRNSFGLAIDPVTNYLWDTENGPDHHDEINLVFPKFNSGWARIQGPTTISDIQNLPIFEHYVYSDPKFSWERPIGVTALLFTQSDLFKKYHNSLFVGDFHNGILYEFKLNNNRTGFIFEDPSLIDLVLNKDDRPTEIIFGTGFAGITDIKEGPDDLIYIVSIGDGTIYRIAPTQYFDSEKSLCDNELQIGINLSGCDLSNLEFQDQNLSSADLSFTNLQNIKLDNVKLQNAILSSANLKNAKLTNVDISGADLGSVILEGTILQDIKATNANLKVVNFKGAKISNTTFEHANLERAYFENIDLSNIIFTNTNLKSAFFKNVNLSNAKLSHSNLQLAIFENVDLSNSDLRNAIVWKTLFNHTNLEGANMVSSDLYDSRFISSSMNNADLRNSKISYSNFTESNLSGVNFLNAYPFETTFNNVITNEQTQINTCLEHDLFSRILNKMLRSIRQPNFSFLEGFEWLLVQMCTPL